MDNEKLIAQISSSEEAWVDRISIRLSSNTSLSSHMPHVEELRKKTIRMEGMAKSRMTKLKLQENFEKLKTSLNFEYGDNLILNLKSNEMTIYSRWIEGVTLKDFHLKEEPLKYDDIARIKNKLRLWVRIFEHLSFFHVNGIIHGNIKPENILIRDRSTVDSKQTYNSEFFDKKMDVPYVALLDGGYSHFLEFQKENIDTEILRSQLATEKKIWLSPEAHGFLEGSYKENSDVYSLAAIMAWDFGLIEINKYSMTNSLWNLYHTPDANSFCLGNKIYKWPNRNSLSDMLKRLKTILMRALEPLHEKRNISARDIAFEIMIMTNRLVDVLDTTPTEITNNKPIEKLSHPDKKEILIKKFDIPDKILSFLLKEDSHESNRLWIEARNKSANKHALMRSINTGLNTVGNSCFYFDVKLISSKIPFYNLDVFCNSLLSYVLHINPEFIEEIRSMFIDFGNEIKSIFFVLPSLRNYAEVLHTKIHNTKNSAIQIQHESVQKNIEDLILKIISVSKLNFIMIDDINRADHSSLLIILKLLTNSKIKLRWIVGIRMDEELESEATENYLQQIKHKDLCFASIKDNRTMSYWITKLNTLSKNEAKLLSIFTLNSTEINFETFEILSNKFINSSGLVNNDNLPESTSNNNVLETELIDDLIPSEESIPNNKQNTTLEPNDEKKNKDSLFYASDILKRAINLGIINENRDISTGYLVSYYWEHQFVLQCLSMLLEPKIKSDIYSTLFSIYQSSSSEYDSLTKIIHITDCLMKSKMPQSHVGAYQSLLIATEKLCDIYSAEYIIKKLQLLEENIELERPADASILITKIREQIADISRSINKNEIAVKYYDAVSWNLVNRKNLSILTIKSFFPSQIKNREARTKEFYRILAKAGKSNFISELKVVKSYDLTEKIVTIIYKIQKKLSDEKSYLENVENQNNKDFLKNILIKMNDAAKEVSDNTITQNSSIQEYKLTRDKVMSYFLRSCIGWIDNAHIYPYIIESLSLSLENNDGESTVSLLLSLILTAERNIPLKLRSAILETVTDLVGRMSETYTIYEVLLLRAWSAYFFDGNLLDCKKNIDRLNSSFYELPNVIKQCTKKLQILFEFESLSVQSIEKQKEFSEKYLRKFSDYDLKDWNIGYGIVHLKTAATTLKSIPGDSLFVGNILNEKLDQMLLYSYYIIEEGHANAVSLVCNEAKNLNLRQWFSDPSSHVEYVPESTANLYVDFYLKRNINMIEKDKSKYYNFKTKLLARPKDKREIIFQRYINKFKSILNIKTNGNFDIKSDISYWGEDKAILYNFKLDFAKTQDTEKLHFIAQNLFRSGFLWSAFRIAHKARSNLNTILAEIKELEKMNQESQPNSDHSIAMNIATHESREDHIQFEKPTPYPEHGVALNFILEFMHNFEHHLEEGQFTRANLIEISEFIKKSIPRETDLVESTLAGALKASVKRLQYKIEEENKETKLEIIPTYEEHPVKNEYDKDDLSKAG